jgi:hypothetical protein
MASVNRSFIHKERSPIQTTQYERKLARRSLRLCPGDSVPVVCTPGDASPREEGSPWCYRTSGGTLIEHPSAYGRVGWSNMHYHASTRRVVVGQDWLYAAVRAA